MTLVSYFVNFLRPYAKEPEFVACVMKALEKLGHPVTWKLRQESVKNGQINDTTLQKNIWPKDLAKCNE